MKNILSLALLIISHCMNSQTFDIINPEKNVGLSNWNIVNDDVMGGISKSYLSVNNDNNLIFNGYLSLENNGGFASSRLSFNSKTLEGVKSFKIKLKGDGNTYKLRLNQYDRRASYSSDFKSSTSTTTMGTSCKPAFCAASHLLSPATISNLLSSTFDSLTIIG